MKATGTQAPAGPSWAAARRQLDGLPGGRGLNIAHEAVDRHVLHGEAATADLYSRRVEIREDLPEHEYVLLVDPGPGDVSPSSWRHCATSSSALAPDDCAGPRWQTRP